MEPVAATKVVRLVETSMIVGGLTKPKPKYPQNYL